MNIEEQKTVPLLNKKPKKNPQHLDPKDLESVGLPYAFVPPWLKQLAFLLAIPCLIYLIHTLTIYFIDCKELNFVDMLSSLVVDAFITENLSKEVYVKSLKRKVWIELAISLIFLFGSIYILMKGKQ